jgi:hypothetical protein
MCVDCNSNSTTLPLAEGLPGINGINGIFGGWSGAWIFRASTSGPSATREIRLNNTSLSLVTSMFINKTNRDNLNYANFLATFDNSGYFGKLRLFKEFNNNQFIFAEVLAVTDNGTEYQVDISVVLSNGSFSQNDNIVLTFTPNNNSDEPSKERLNTSLFAGSEGFKSTTSASLTEMCTLGYPSSFGLAVRAFVVLKASITGQSYRINITDSGNNIIWDSTGNLATTNKTIVNLGSRINTPLTGNGFFTISISTNGINSLNLYSVDFYNI